jgi:hypothetical protein
MRSTFWVLAVTVMALAGCGGGHSGTGIATASGGKAKATPSATPSADAEERRRQFAQCMRDHGVDLPDPDPSGGGGLRFNPGTDVDRDKLQAAFEACRPMLPNGGVPPTLSPEQIEQQRQFAQCLREHGVDVPDPDPDTGRLRFNRGGRLDPDDPTFRAALQACQSLRPSFGPGPGVRR